MIDGTGRVAALDGPAKPDDVQPSEGGDVTALPATNHTFTMRNRVVGRSLREQLFDLALEEDPEP